MSRFTADMKELEVLFTERAELLFSLCFIHTGLISDTTELMDNILMDCATSAACFEKLKTDRGAVKLAHRACMDFFGKKVKKKIKLELLKKHNLPFEPTRELASLINLPISLKTPMFCMLRLNMTAEEAGEALRTPSALISRRTQRGLSRSGLSREQAAKALSSVKLGAGSAQRIFDKLLLKMEEKDISRSRAAARFKSRLDRIIPFIALLIIIICIIAVLGVSNGWFSGYDPSVLDEPYNFSSAPTQ